MELTVGGLQRLCSPAIWSCGAMQNDRITSRGTKSWQVALRPLNFKLATTFTFGTLTAPPHLRHEKALLEPWRCPKRRRQRSGQTPVWAPRAPACRSQTAFAGCPGNMFCPLGFEFEIGVSKCPVGNPCCLGSGTTLSTLEAEFDTEPSNVAVGFIELGQPTPRVDWGNLLQCNMSRDRLGGCVFRGSCSLHFYFLEGMAP